MSSEVAPPSDVVFPIATGVCAQERRDGSRLPAPGSRLHPWCSCSPGLCPRNLRPPPGDHQDFLLSSAFRSGERAVRRPPTTSADTRGKTERKEPERSAEERRGTQRNPEETIFVRAAGAHLDPGPGTLKTSLNFFVFGSAWKPEPDYFFKACFFFVVVACFIWRFRSREPLQKKPRLDEETRRGSPRTSAVAPPQHLDQLFPFFRPLFPPRFPVSFPRFSASSAEMRSLLVLVALVLSGAAEPKSKNCNEVRAAYSSKGFNVNDVPNKGVTGESFCPNLGHFLAQEPCFLKVGVAAPRAVRGSNPEGPEAPLLPLFLSS